MIKSSNNWHELTTGSEYGGEGEASWQDLRSSNIGWWVMCWLADAWIAVERWWQLDTDGPFMMFGMQGPRFNPPRWDHIPWQKFSKIIYSLGQKYLATFDYITDEEVRVDMSLSYEGANDFKAHVHFENNDFPSMTLDNLSLIEVK